MMIIAFTGHHRPAALIIDVVDSVPTSGDIVTAAGC
jgi:hypothetical protein